MWRNKDEVSEANWFQISSHLQQKHRHECIDHGCTETLSALDESSRSRSRRCPSPLPPSFSDKTVIIGDLTRQLPPPLTSAHNNWSAKLQWKLQSLKVFQLQTTTASKKCPPAPFNTLWTKLLILGMQHKSPSSGIQVSVSFQSLPLKFCLIYLKFNDKSERASVQPSNHSQGDTRNLRSVPFPQIPVIISTYLHHWLCVWRRGSAGLSVPLLRTDQETRNKQD